MDGRCFSGSFNRKDRDLTTWSEMEMKYVQPLVFIVIIMLTALPHAANDDRGTVVRIQSEYDGATLHREFTKGTNHALIHRYRQAPPSSGSEDACQRRPVCGGAS